MDASEISPKRRRLDDSGTVPDGKNGQNASLLDKNGNVQGTEYCNKSNHHKGLKWIKEVGPEDRQCSRRIVENLKQTIPERNIYKNCEKAAVKPSMKLPKLLKQDAGEDTTSKASVLENNCPTIVVSHEVTLESPRNFKDSKSGCIVENPATSQETSSGLTIPSPVNKDNIRDEIKKIVKGRTREVLAAAEKLQSRVSTLETENRNLKHKVKMLYKTIRGALAGQKEDLSTVEYCVVQTKPQVQATGFRTMESVPATQNQPLSQVVTLPDERYKSAPFDSEAVGKAHQTFGALPPSNALISWSLDNHKNAYEPAGLVDTESHSPFISLNKEAIAPSLSVSSQTSYVQTKNTALNQRSGSFSSVVCQPYKVINSSTNRNTTSIKRNPISVLHQVLEQILPDDNTALPLQATNLSRPKAPTGSNSCKVSPECLIINPSEGEVSQTSSPLKRSLQLSPLNTACGKPSQHDKDATSTHHPEFIFSTSPEAFKVDIKSGILGENTRQMASVGSMETKAILTDSVKPRCSAFADTPISVSEVQSNVSLAAAPANYLRNPENSRANSKVERLLDDTHQSKKGATSFMANSGMPDSKSYANNPSFKSQIQPKVSLPATPGTHFKEQKTIKVDSKCRVLLGNTCLVTSAAAKEAPPLTMATERTHFYKDTPFASFDAQPEVAFTASSDTSFSLLSQPTQMDGQDYNVPITSVCPSIVSISTSTKGQKEGLLNGISPGLETNAAGLETNDAKQVVSPVLSTPKPILPFPGSRISNERTEQDNLALNKHSINNSDVFENSVPFFTTPFTSPSQFYPITAANPISEPYFAYKAHNCTTVSVDGTNVYKIASPIALYPNVPNADDKTSQRYIKSPGHKNDGRTIFDLQRKANNIALTPQNVSNCNLPFGAFSPNKYQMMPRQYSNSQIQQHKPRTLLAPNIVISRPRYQPYPPNRVKGKEAHLLPLLWPNTHNAPSIHERRSPKPQGTPTPDVSLNSDEHSCLKKRPEFPDMIQMEHMRQKNMPCRQPICSHSPEPVSHQIGLKANARINSTLNSIQLDLRNPPKLDPRHNPRLSMAIRNSPRLDFQTTINTVKPSIKSPETSKRNVHRNSQNYVQDNKRTTKESWVYNGTSLSSTPSSVTESDKRDCTTPKRPLSNPSSKSNSRVKPHLEMSQSCQLYLSQLRKSAEVRAISAENSINGKPIHLNSASHSEREIVNGNNSWQQDAQFIFQSGLVRQQRKGYNDQPKVNPPTLTTHGNKDGTYVMKHQNPRYLMFHHQKFTNRQRKKAFQGGLLIPVCCKKPSETRQSPEEPFKEQNPKSKLEICHPSLTEVNTEPRKK